MKKLLATILLFAAPCFAIGPVPYPINGDGPSVIQLRENAMSFVRSSTAPYYDSTGTVQTAGVNEPAMSYFYIDGAWDGPWLVIRPEMENLVPYSDPSNTGESNGANVTYGAYSWPVIGMANAGTFGDNSVARTSYGQPALVATETYTISLFVLMDDNSEPTVGTSTSTGNFALAGDSTILSTAATVRHVGSNVYQITNSFTSANTGVRNCGVYKGTAASSATGFKMSGVQVVNNAFPPPVYIATSGSPITIASEAGTNSGASVTNGASWVISDKISSLWSSGGSFTCVFALQHLADFNDATSATGILATRSDANSHPVWCNQSSGWIFAHDQTSFTYVDRDWQAWEQSTVVWSASGSTQRISAHDGTSWETNTQTYDGDIITSLGNIMLGAGLTAPIAYKLPIKIYSKDYDANYTRFTP